MFDVTATGGVVFHAASGLEANAIAQVQAQVRRRLLRVLVRRGLLPDEDAQAMGQWQHGGGFSVDASIRIEATDRAGRERLLRYCARPPFALDRLRERDGEHLIYEPPKPGPGGSGPQCLTPLELLDRLAALVPPRRLHASRPLPLRSAGADGGFRANWLARSKVCNWPTAGVEAIQPSGCRLAYCSHPGVKGRSGSSSRRSAPQIVRPWTTRSRHRSEPEAGIETDGSCRSDRGKGRRNIHRRTKIVPALSRAPAFEFDQRLGW